MPELLDTCIEYELNGCVEPDDPILWYGTPIRINKPEWKDQYVFGHQVLDSGSCRSVTLAKHKIRSSRIVPINERRECPHFI